MAHRRAVRRDGRRNGRPTAFQRTPAPGRDRHRARPDSGPYCRGEVLARPSSPPLGLHEQGVEVPAARNDALAPDVPHSILSGGVLEVRDLAAKLFGAGRRFLFDWLKALPAPPNPASNNLKSRSSQNWLRPRLIFPGKGTEALAAFTVRSRNREYKFPDIPKKFAVLFLRRCSSQSAKYIEYRGLQLVELPKGLLKTDDFPEEFPVSRERQPESGSHLTAHTASIALGSRTGAQENLFHIQATGRSLAQERQAALHRWLWVRCPVSDARCARREVRMPSPPWPRRARRSLRLLTACIP